MIRFTYENVPQIDLQVFEIREKNDYNVKKMKISCFNLFFLHMNAVICRKGDKSTFLNFIGEEKNTFT